MLIWLVICVVFGANPSGSDGPTVVFNSHGPSNSNGYYFIPETFINIDVCTHIDNRAEFLALLAEKNIQCGSRYWCIDNKFLTNEAHNRNYYELEHIIDRSNMEYGDCDTSIIGNLIMAYGVWNNQVGQLNWNAVKKEKALVYGNIFSQAERNVITCCTQQVNRKYYIIGYTMFGVFVCMGVLYAILRYRGIIGNKNDEIKYTVINQD